MNCFNKISFIIGACAAIASCNLLERESSSTFDEASVFSNYDLARAAMNGIYDAYLVTTAYRSDYFMYFGANTDVEYWVSNGDDERSSICKYRISPNNQYISNSVNTYFFPAIYNSIERANVCISNLRKYGDVNNDSRMANLLGEALTVRSLYYADLMNTYGEVPARFEPLTGETVYIPKTDRDIIYKHLLADLEEAASLMEFDAQTTTTRPGKACALGLYARLALQAAGYARRPNEGKVNTGDIGSIRKSTDPDLQAEVTYPKALTYLQDVIDSHKFSLFDNFEDLWHYYCNLRTTIDDNGAEVIYALPFGPTRGHHIAYNGVPDKKLAPETSSGRKGIVPSLYFKYPAFDTRRDVTCSFVKWDSEGEVNTSDLKSEYCYMGKFRFNWMEEHPYNGQKEGDDGAKYIYMRYADIYLMAAEIANALDDLEGAKGYMKPVLDRAWHNDTEVENYLNSLSSKEAFFEAIKDQRAFEFAGEMLRKQDLIRWGILKESLDRTKQELTDLSALTGLAEGLEDAIYWRYKGDGKDKYQVEIKFRNPDEEAEPSYADGWKKKEKYLSTFSQKTIKNYYLEDPDQYMYRPIPAPIIIASLNTLQNDYGYTNE